MAPLKEEKDDARGKDIMRKFVFWTTWFLAAISIYLWFGRQLDTRGLQVSIMGALILLFCNYLGGRLRQGVVRLALLGMMIAAAVYLYLSAFKLIYISVDIRLVQVCILAVLIVAGIIHSLSGRSDSRLSGMS